MRAEPIPAEPSSGFEIVASREGGERVVSIPPDLATCPDCLSEVRNPADRRYQYPFTNCTHCGPRYTIARDSPYDPGRDDDGRLHDVPGLQARVRGPR